MVAGSLQEKKGYYYIVLNLQDELGKRKPKWIATGLAVKGNKKRAEQMLSETRRAYDNPTFIPGGEMLFTELMNSWLPIIKNNVQLTTYTGYLYTVERRIVPFFEKHPVKLNQFEPKHLQAYYSYMREDLQLSANTVIHHHAIIRKALDYAFKAGFIQSNPADRVERPKKPDFLVSYYDDVKLFAMFEVMRYDIIELPVLIAAYYGLRRSEVIGLKWDAIDFADKTITIRHSATQITIDGKYTFYTKDILKTKSSFRTLPLIPTIESALLRAKANQEKCRAVAGRSYNKEYMDYVCVDDLGNIIKPGLVSHRFGRILENHDLPKIRFHDLRHSCASLLLKNGVSIKEIQEWLGHSNFSTTANIYAHLEYSAKVTSAQTIQNALNPA